MFRYDPLYRWLCAKSAAGLASVSATFEEIDVVLGLALPDSARTSLQWWANEYDAARHAQCRAWLDAGFETKEVNLNAQTVRFVSV